MTKDVRPLSSSSRAHWISSSGWLSTLEVASSRIRMRGRPASREQWQFGRIGGDVVCGLVLVAPLAGTVQDVADETGSNTGDGPQRLQVAGDSRLQVCQGSGEPCRTITSVTGDNGVDSVVLPWGNKKTSGATIQEVFLMG